jgi:hypothetical protein
MGIDPTEDPPIKPGQPAEPPQEDPPGDPRPEIPPPVQDPSEPSPPQELPGSTPDELPLRGPAQPQAPYPATDSGITDYLAPSPDVNSGSPQTPLATM